MSWNQLPLGEICSLITDGKHGDCQNEENSGFYFLSAKDVREGRLQYEGAREITYDGFIETHRRTALECGDVLLTNSGTIGRLAIATDDPRTAKTTFQKSVAVLKPIRDRITSHFLYYQLAANKSRLIQSSAGAAQKNLLLGELRRFEIFLPDVQEQKRIASILSAYDDLIENNRRRIALLEEAARLLYREWFVHFRFPGHEHVKIVDGVPEGWEQLAISDVCVVGRGASPRPIQKFVGGDVPWFKIGDATASPSAFIFETKEHVIPEGAAKSVRLPKGELILSNSATCGVPNFTGVEGCIHDGWLYFKDLKRVSKLFLFLYLEQQQKALLQGIGEGATQKNLNTNYVGRQKFRIPSETALLETFEQMVVPIFEQIERLARLNNETAKARDLLLPRLMDGRLEV